jgi:hypothetical protein
VAVEFGFGSVSGGKKLRLPILMRRWSAFATCLRRPLTHVLSVIVGIVRDGDQRRRCRRRTVTGSTLRPI